MVTAQEFCIRFWLIYVYIYWQSRQHYIERRTSLGLFPLSTFICEYPGAQQTTRLGIWVTNYPDTAALNPGLPEKQPLRQRRKNHFSICAHIHAGTRLFVAVLLAVLLTVKTLLCNGLLCVELDVNPAH